MQCSATELILLAKAEATAVTNFNTPSESHQEQPESENSKPELELFSLKHKPFRDSELRFIGWKRPKNAPPITCPESSLWVDKRTGELFTQKQAQEHGITVGHSKSLGMVLIQSIIQSCPPGKRDFVRYILRLRNTRGGLAVDLETALNRWIAYENPTMDSTDRARKRKTLENFLYKRGILANNQTFTKDLQFIADSTRKDYLSETFKFVRALPLTGQRCYERHSNSLGTETTGKMNKVHVNSEAQQ